MIQDFKFALRHLLKAPGFTATAVLTLALAIGVNSAIFALINSVVLHPVVPLRPNEVVNVFTARQNASHDYRQFSYNEYRELRENGGDVFADLATLEFAVAGIGRDHEMRRSFAFLTSENYFSLMGQNRTAAGFTTRKNVNRTRTSQLLSPAMVFGNEWAGGTILSAAHFRSTASLTW
jgi:hypothetical protein